MKVVSFEGLSFIKRDKDLFGGVLGLSDYYSKSTKFVRAVLLLVLCLFGFFELILVQLLIIHCDTVLFVSIFS